jgi:nicotinate-nucleotide adenylyltransferase
MKKIGLFGGSFNPIHTGHLLLADAARDTYKLDKVLFIPTGDNPLKNLNTEVDRMDRLKMAQLAVASNPYFEVSDMEILRDGKSYTIDTLREVQKRYDDAEFYFITGADIMFEITRWRDSETLLRSLIFVTSFRPGYSHRKLDARIAELEEKYQTRILKLNALQMDIASSDIRGRVMDSRPIKYLVPEAVENYILEHELYRKEVASSDDGSGNEGAAEEDA